MQDAPGGLKAPIEAERVTFRRLARSDFDRIFSRRSREKGVEPLGYTVCGEEIARWSYRDGDAEIPVVEDYRLMRKRVA
jgi:hypothetical protein